MKRPVYSWFRRLRLVHSDRWNDVTSLFYCV